jgi:capsular exopolysaccharide synthesis family protein
MLRTSVLLTGDDPGAIGVTSAGQAEGKTVTCANLALVFAQSGKRVVVVDADMRLPSQHLVFGVTEPGSGLGALLVSADITDEAIANSVRTVAENVDLIPAGRPAHNPSELLGAPAFQTLLANLKSSYDIVLVDTPPTNYVTDSIVVSRFVDGMLLVMDYQESGRSAARNAVNALRRANANILGSVLNRYAHDSMNYGGGYLGEYGAPVPQETNIESVSCPRTKA